MTDSRGWVRPWALASGVACGALATLALLESVWPGAFAWLRLRETPLRLTFAAYHVGPRAPLWSLTAWVTVLYCAVGIGGVVPILRRCRGLRAPAALLLSSVGSAALLFLPPLLCIVWIVAARTHAIPTGEWGVNEGNHGPWRHAYDLRGALTLALGLPWVAAAGSGLAAVLQPWRATFAPVIVSAATFIVLLASHYWLID